MNQRPMRTTPSDMTGPDIKIAMIRAGVTQAQLARELKVSKQCLHLVVEGRVVSHRIRSHIAKRIGIDIRRIWPGTYLHGGPRKPGRVLHAPAEDAVA
jgi:lambda repressor-like predicted transcriptional regulator